MGRARGAPLFFRIVESARTWERANILVVWYSYGMEHVPREEKFNPQELKELQEGLVNLPDLKMGTDLIVGFLKYNGYGADANAIHTLLASGTYKIPFEDFKKQLENIALEN